LKSDSLNFVLGFLLSIKKLVTRQLTYGGAHPFFFQGCGFRANASPDSPIPGKILIPDDITEYTIQAPEIA
jgi:hypothetical protein